MQQSPNSSSGESAEYSTRFMDGEIDLRAVFREIYSGWRILLIFVGIALLWAIFSLHTTKPVYESQMLISPAQDNETDNLGISGGLASLAGLSIGGESNSDFGKFQVLLTSRVLADSIIRETDLLPRLFSNQWDGEAEQWHEPRDLKTIAKKPVKAILSMQPWHSPDVEDLYLFLTNKINLESSLESSMITVSYRNSDPALAQKVLATIHQKADDIVREQARANAEKRVARLIEVLPQTKVREHRNAIIAILSEEQRKLILAEVDRYFIADLIAPPSLPTIRAAPKPVMVVVSKLVLGLFWGLGLIAVRTFMKNRRS